MKLAINGGKPVRTKLFPNQCNIGPEEKAAAQRVLDTGMLSGYRGNAQKYRGGTEIQALEKMWSEKFGNKHSIAINSCTSALHIALGAIGIKPGDEVIVTPYSMTCSATAPMLWEATPVFADVEKDYFCLDPEDVERKITDKTKAIIAVDLFGQPFSERLNALAMKHNLYIIEDAAQALGSSHGETYTGNLGHISCFSMTQGKHITAGEGGMITTNNDELALKCRLLMNHAEAVVNDYHNQTNNKYFDDFNPDFHKLWGFNMRMTEIQAAIAQEQLKKLDFFIGKRQENAEYLIYGLTNLPPITRGFTRNHCTHTYYCQPFLWNQETAEGSHRDIFINAVKAELQPMRGREDEGVRIGNGYIKPLYRMPVFADRFNKPSNQGRLWQAQEWFGGHPITGSKRSFITDSVNSISPLPNVEKLWKDELFLHLYLAPPTSRADLDDIIEAFNKVWENRDELR